MHHLFFSDEERDSYPVALLVSVIRKDDIKKAYVDNSLLVADELLVMDLHYSQTAKKTPMVEMRQYITEVLVPIFEQAKTKVVMVADAEYFKALTKLTKTELYLGYVVDSAFGDFKVAYVPNYRQMFYDPIKVTKGITQGIEAVVQYQKGLYQDPGKGIIHYEAYPVTDAEIEQWLNKLLDMNCPLTIDIEGFDLKHDKCGIATISFAWNQHEGIAFAIDAQEIPGATEAPYFKNVPHLKRRAMLKSFFYRLRQRAIYHNIAFDVNVLVYQLFMDDILDTEGLLEGMDVMLRDWDCTKLITYLATNSCAGNQLSLKDQAQEFAGNYAVEEIKDITKIPLPKLLTYNLVDSLSTWFVHDKRKPQMIADQQEDFYNEIFKPATLDVVQMQLTGMPVNMRRVKEVKVILQADEKKALKTINSSSLVQRYQHQRMEAWVAAKNKKLVKKRVTLDDAKLEILKPKSPVRWNPNSPDQLQEILYEMIGLPVIAYTKTKQPSADGDTLKALLNHTSNVLVKELLNALMAFKLVDKMLTSFIPAMEKASLGKDGWHYLFGNFNLGGTVSGRLSSSKPNLQNLPANSIYAKLIKSCFEAPPGWLLMGLDFASLEDRISALTTKDPNKLKVYTDGYDGHSLRTFAYFPDQCVGIVDTVSSINSIQVKYKDLRYDSKAPTFALTYQGTYKTLMTNCGFTEPKAKAIEEAYHELYHVSDKWVADKLDQACKDGYVTVAFGLRVRTPLLHQVVRGTRQTPFKAEAEGRTAGNALGQSWCLLNSRAGSETMGKVRKSEYRLDIRPCAQIHDAGYFLVRDDIGAVMFLNKHLVEAVKWQDHPDIWHDEVKLGGDLSLFFPDWSKEAVIPNGATEEEIRDVIGEHVQWLTDGCPKR